MNIFLKLQRQLNLNRHVSSKQPLSNCSKREGFESTLHHTLEFVDFNFQSQH